MNTPPITCAEWRDEDLVVNVRVSPRASRNVVLGVENHQLRIRTTAVPADGRANKALLRLLADYLQVPQSHITLLSGATNRNKRFLIAGPLALPDGLPVASRVSNGL